MTIYNSDSSAPSKENEAVSDPKQKLKEPEIGGPKGPEPTCYGDWEVKGRVSDF